ncbi:DUF6503 family protein, partial [Persicitalea sp.]|uniref:DUF6503 family protein n=1 Tax=Persicitalea sp. TaxID=3100273 RepID=UPI003593E95E
MPIFSLKITLCRYAISLCAFVWFGIPTLCLFETAYAQDTKTLLNQCLGAHGGIEKWNSYEALRYKLDASGKTSVQTIQLHDRRTHHKATNYEMGYDGTKTWLVGDKKDVPTGNPDFYHNLDFYFFAMPFVIADPGIILSHGGQMEAEGKTFDVLEVRYNDNVGVAPKDVYRLLIDPVTHRMEWLLYTVTFFNQDSQKMSAKKYLDWKNVQGLLVPTRMENYSFADGVISGEPSAPRIFSEIKFFKKLK